MLFQIRSFDPEKYKIISEEDWKEMVKKDLSESQIQKEDEEKVDEFEKFLRNTTLCKNSLSSLRELNVEVKEEKELRIVLVGKVREPSFPY